MSEKQSSGFFQQVIAQAKRDLDAGPIEGWWSWYVKLLAEGKYLPPPAVDQWKAKPPQCLPASIRLYMTGLAAGEITLPNHRPKRGPLQRDLLRASVIGNYNWIDAEWDVPPAAERNSKRSAKGWKIRSAYTWKIAETAKLSQTTPDTVRDILQGRKGWPPPDEPTIFGDQLSRP